MGSPACAIGAADGRKAVVIVDGISDVEDSNIATDVWSGSYEQAPRRSRAARSRLHTRPNRDDVSFGTTADAKPFNVQLDYPYDSVACYSHYYYASSATLS
jgi:hypothetical protein